jgi:hypothetical protein
MQRPHRSYWSENTKPLELSTGMYIGTGDWFPVLLVQDGPDRNISGLNLEVAWKEMLLAHFRQYWLNVL